MRPLRFCFVTTFYPPHHFGGDAVFVYRLAESLAARGHQVHVLHSMDAYHLRTSAEADVAFAHHANVTRFPLATSSAFWSTLAVHQTGRPSVYSGMLQAHFAQHAYDVIHYHNVSLMGAPGLLRLGDAVKLYTTHEYWLICPTHVLFKYQREACTSRACVRCTLRHGRPLQLWRVTDLMEDSLAHLDALLMPSRFALERHRRDGIDGRMVVLPHFVPIPTDAELGTELPAPERPYFLYVGRLEKLKGVQDLLSIFSTYSGADLLIAGTGRYEAELRGMARGSPHVKFLGALHPSALSEYYRRATAVLVPSLCYETFAQTAAEALSYGTPVIGRRLGALEELLDATEGGISFDTAAECRAAMELMLREPALRTDVGSRGREFARRNWTIDRHLEQYFALIAERMALRAERSTHGTPHTDSGSP